MSFSIVFAWLNECIDNCFLACLVLATSINYWRWPVFGTRRTIDMVCAIGSLAYQVLFTSRRTTQRARRAYVATVIAGSSCYLCARHFSSKRRDFNTSSALHVGLHVFGNLGNVLLYDSLGMDLLRLR
jgi:hypothetical protein